MFRWIKLSYFTQLSFSIVLSLSFSCGLVACKSDPGNANNHPPTAATMSITTNEDTPSIPLTPSVSDSDEGDSYTFTIITPPSEGSVIVVNNQFIYTPDVNYNGPDTFTFSARDSGGLSVTGTATVTVNAVNDAPAATRVGSTALEGTANSPVTPYVDDPDMGDTFTYQILSAPAYGSASVVGNQIVYTSDSGFIGTDKTDNFSYQVTDNDNQTISGTALVRFYNNANLARCTGASVNNGDGTATRITAGPCAFYGEAVTRTTASGAPVTVKYITLRPSNGASPKGVVFLIAGGDLNANITGDVTTGLITTTGGNFLVRTAQLFAEAGYVSIAMDRPSDRPTATPADPVENIDLYRISVDHAIDIVGVLRYVNTDNLDVFLAGTSRGAISVVANNLIAAGILISSPVTNNNGLANRLYVGDPNHTNLLAGYVQRPVHTLWHTDDACPASDPAGSKAWFNALAANAQTYTIESQTVIGGFYITNPAVDNCGALSYHGFLGIEPTAVGYTTTWLDTRITALAGNHRPTAAFITVRTSSGKYKQINLASLTSDADSNKLSYALPYASTSLGGTVSVSGSTLTYIPPQGVSNQADYFVYVVTDGGGGVNAATIAVEIGS